jgi:hypothetical protein
MIIPADTLTTAELSALHDKLLRGTAASYNESEALDRSPVDPALYAVGEWVPTVAAFRATGAELLDLLVDVTAEMLASMVMAELRRPVYPQSAAPGAFPVMGDPWSRGSDQA